MNLKYCQKESVSHTAIRLLAGYLTDNMLCRLHRIPSRQVPNGRGHLPLQILTQASKLPSLPTQAAGANPTLTTAIMVQGIPRTLKALLATTPTTRHAYSSSKSLMQADMRVINPDEGFKFSPPEELRCRMSLSYPKQHCTRR